MTTIILNGGDLGRERVKVRTNLSRSESPVEVDWCMGAGWTHTQYQCADTRHSRSGLTSIGKSLAAHAMEMPEATFDCDCEVIDE